MILDERNQHDFLRCFKYSLYSYILQFPQFFGVILHVTIGLDVKKQFITAMFKCYALQGLFNETFRNRFFLVQQSRLGSSNRVDFNEINCILTEAQIIGNEKFPFIKNFWLYRCERCFQYQKFVSDYVNSKIIYKS